MALTFPKVFKLMNDEYGVQSSDGENVLNALRANKENEFFEEETQDCTPSYSSSSKRKERDEQSEDDDNTSMLWSKLWKSESYLIQKLLKMHLMTCSIKLNKILTRSMTNL